MSINPNVAETRNEKVLGNYHQNANQFDTTASRDGRDKYQPAMILERRNCLFDSCLSEIVRLEVFLESSVSVLVFLPTWAVTNCVMVLFCRLAVRPDHFQFLRLIFVSLDFSQLSIVPRFRSIKFWPEWRDKLCEFSQDFHGFYHLGMSQAGVSKEPIIVFPTEGTLKMFTKTMPRPNFLLANCVVSNTFRLADFPAVFF